MDVDGDGMERAATLEDVARASGYSTATVSFALRGGMGKVRESTRERIVEVAERLNYRPSGAGALLAMRRHYPRVSSGRPDVLCLDGARGDQRFAGFRECASGLGMEARLRRVGGGEDLGEVLREAWNRGIEGICLLSESLPWSEAAMCSVDWGRFSVVQWTRRDQLPRFHLVRHSAFDTMLLALSRVFERGFRRVGVLACRTTSLRDDLAREGAVMAFRENLLPGGGELGWRYGGHPRLAGAGEIREVMDWVARGRWEAVIVFPFYWYYLLVEHGFRIPRELGVATLLAHRGLPDTPDISGCAAVEEEVGGRLAKRLHELLRRGGKGIPDRALEDVVESVWIDGETLGEARERGVGRGDQGVAAGRGSLPVPPALR